MNEILSYKSIVGEVKDVDTKKRVITGYLSGFDNKDYDGDIIVKGAFKKSIDERKNDIYRIISARKATKNEQRFYRENT